MALADSILMYGTRASQPAAAPENNGCYYRVTDEGDIVEQSDGAVWTPIATTAGGGTVTNTGTLTDHAVILGNGTVDVTALGSLGSSGQVLTSAGAGADPTWQTPSSGSGTVVQVKNSQSGAVATGFTGLPMDDTIPQNTEGDEYFTLAITPTDAANKLKIDVVIFGSIATAGEIIVALFQDSTANALAALSMTDLTNTARVTIPFSHYMTAGTTSATTFKVRVGTGNSATFTLNGVSGGRLYGGVATSGITITEIIP